MTVEETFPHTKIQVIDFGEEKIEDDHGLG